MHANKKLSRCPSESVHSSHHPTLGRARFVLTNPEAEAVFVAGSFNDWNPGASPLNDLGHGHWVLELSLPPGRYEYLFVVDGRWMPDHSAKESVVNPFEGINSVIQVTQPQFTPAPIKARRKRINPKWSWHYHTLKRMRDRLACDRRQLIAETSQAVGRYSMHMADSASDELDHNVAISELAVEQDTLYQVEQAIERIENDTYGRCEFTGKPIPAARLRAIPWTRFSERAAETLERETAALNPAAHSR